MSEKTTNAPHLIADSQGYAIYMLIPISILVTAFAVLWMGGQLH